MLRSLLTALKAFGPAFFLMRHRRSILCIALVASSCCCQAATANQPTLLSEAEMQAVRSMSIEVEPRLKDEKDPLRIASLLRNMLHWRIPFLRDTKKLQTYDWMDVDETYRKSLFDSQYGHACGGRAIQYLAALRAFGIPARKVGFLTEVENARNPVDAHATVEVLIGGKWIAMDPHFNFSLADENGELIGWIDAVERLHNDNSHDDPRIVDLGFPARPGYDVHSYTRKTGISLKKLTQFTYTTGYWDGQVTVSGIKMPAHWDGVIRYRDGMNFPVFTNEQTSIYGMLAGPSELVVQSSEDRSRGY